MSEYNEEDYRKDCRDREMYNHLVYDKVTLTLSSAGLGLSLTAIPLINVEYINLIYLAWVLLPLGIISSMVGFKTANINLNNAIRNIYDESYDGTKSKYYKIGIISDWSAGLCLLIGYCLIIYFKILNT